MNKFLNIFKNMNLKNWRLKAFVLIFFVFLFSQSSISFGALNSLQDGWRVNKNFTKKSPTTPAALMWLLLAPVL